MLRTRLQGMPLPLAIALALALKAALLFALWRAFFAAPQAPHMRMATSQVERQVLGAAPPPVPSRAAP